MAKPTGAVSVGEIYYFLHEDTRLGATENFPQEMYFILRAQPQPQEYQVDGVTGYNMAHRLARQVKINSSGNLIEYWNLGQNDAPKAALTDYPHTQAANFNGTLSDDQIHYPDGHKMAKQSVEKGEQIQYLVGRAVCHSDAGQGNVYQYCTMFVALHDNGYAGVGTENVKRTADRLYAPDYPCSAWHVMKALAETHKKILYENRPFFAVPTFGDCT